MVFLLTDTQISKESFLEDVNNLLNTGEVPGMFAPEDKDRILGSIREWLVTQAAPTSKVRCCTASTAQRIQPAPAVCPASCSRFLPNGHMHSCCQHMLDSWRPKVCSHARCNVTMLVTSAQACAD